MHFKIIIKPKHQMATGPATDLSVGSFCLDEEILRRVLAKASST
jgi:hypothetical protein